MQRHQANQPMKSTPKQADRTIDSRNSRGTRFETNTKKTDDATQKIIAPAGSKLDRWVKHKVLLGRYEVIDQVGEGGMGVVYLARRMTDGELFAVKTLHCTLTSDSDGRRSIFNEIRTWMDLPSHPHLTACRFFRTIEDRLAIFAEYIDGGSLKTAIQNQQFLDLESIFDIAIQFAWGLHAAHTWGVVHQDVKPANVLLTKTGTVKVTDFGLSSIQKIQQRECTDDEASDNTVTARGMTLAYCSPEQCQFLKLDCRSDIWSWGVSILEMFTGKAHWELGVKADIFLQEYPKLAPYLPYPIMPADLYSILVRCLAYEPDARWPDCETLARQLIILFSQLFGKPYFRSAPEFPTRSKIIERPYKREDLFQQTWSDPRTWLEKAVKTSGRVNYETSSSPQREASSGITQILTDFEVAEEAQCIYANLVQSGRTDLRLDLGELLSDKATIQLNAADLPGARQSYTQALAFLDQVVDEISDGTFQRKYTHALMGRGVVYYQLGQFQPALDDFHRAVIILTEVFSKRQIESVGRKLAFALINQALASAALGRINDSFSILAEAERLITKLTTLFEKSEDDLLAFVYMNRVNLYDESSQLDEALQDSETCIRLWEKLRQLNADRHSSFHLLSSLINHSVRLLLKQRHLPALEVLDRAAALTTELADYLNESVEQYYRTTITGNRAAILMHMNRNQEALTEIVRAIDSMNQLILDQGRSEHEGMLARMIMYKAEILRNLSAYSEALTCIDSAVDILERLKNHENRSDLDPLLISARSFKCRSLADNGEFAAAKQMAQQVVGYCQDLLLEHENPQLHKIYEETLDFLTRIPQLESDKTDALKNR